MIMAGFDMFQSRRDYNETCRWWERNDDSDIPLSDLVAKRVPSGSFSAKEVTAEQLMRSVLAGVFRIDSTHITIKSPDDLEGISADCAVEYRGEMWMVSNVQRSVARRQNTYFAKPDRCSHFWYIELRR